MVFALSAAASAPALVHVGLLLFGSSTLRSFFFASCAALMTRHHVVLVTGAHAHTRV